ncbi:hypothetical protein GGX14DRAFT_611278 [Mycena pura]|uniref:Uncharacterized protein n=1 Tax=Mycena pura TaxID=153505 RepID=A0AAD6UKI3_9AGAR|nr:hypothetical protein GGX14DRAFT_611278 [Mycena pura]
MYPLTPKIYSDHASYGVEHRVIAETQITHTPTYKPVAQSSGRGESTIWNITTGTLCPTQFRQNLQQSRGFRNNFKFPGGEGAPVAPATTSTGNAGFTEDTADDDLNCFYTANGAAGKDDCAVHAAGALARLMLQRDRRGGAATGPVKLLPRIGPMMGWIDSPNPRRSSERVKPKGFLRTSGRKKIGFLRPKSWILPGQSLAGASRGLPPRGAGPGGRARRVVAQRNEHGTIRHVGQVEVVHNTERDENSGMDSGDNSEGWEEGHYAARGRDGG